MNNVNSTFNLGQFHCLVFCIDVKHICEKKIADKCNTGNCPTFPLAQSSEQ